MPTVGEPAPDFTLKSHHDDEVSLSDFKGDKNVVLVFYPLDFSPVCSVQLPEYSDSRDEFAAHDTVILGVNRDSVYAHRAWAKEYAIEVPLLADMTGKAARAYGVYLDEAGINKRAVFLVDKRGVLRFAHVEQSPGDFTFHAGELLERLDDLTG